MILAVEIGSGVLGIVVLIAGLASGVLIVAVLGLTARRLLGVRVGVVRTVAASGVGYVVAGLVSSAISAVKAGKSVGASQLVFIPVLIGIYVLVAMGFLVLAEAIVPSGSRPRPVRALRRRLARAVRYSQITGIAVRHGLGSYLRGRGRAGAGADATHGQARLARSLRLALTEGGVTFIKLGQLLSTRRDLLAMEFVDELGQLQNQAAPAPWSEVEQLLIDEMGSPPGEVFAEFDPEPLAAASIAQVHAARLRSGAAVVVKVQRPGIRPVVERDLDIVFTLARTIEARSRLGSSPQGTVQTPMRRGLNIVELADGFATALGEELDFRVEARNMRWR